MHALLQRCALAVVLFGATTHEPLNAAPVLDAGFGGDGIEAISGLRGFVEALGSCPHADGSITLVGFRQETTSLVMARLNERGDLDTRFSNDGLHSLRIGTAMDVGSSATACAGVGNGSAADDRMLITATVPGSHEIAVAILVDLESGNFNPDFYLGGPAYWDISAMLFPPQQGAYAYPHLRMRGAFPGPDNGWLLVGQLIGASSDDARGFIVRTNAVGAIEAAAQPNAGGFGCRELNLARVGADGAIRALGTGVIASHPAWGLLKLDAVTLQPVELLASGESPLGAYRAFKGRHIAGGLMVAATLQGDDSALGSAPRLLIVRGDQVNEVVLPAPTTLGGEPVGPAGMDGSVVATGASGGRVVFAMQLRGLSNAMVGYYAAVVQLGDGGSVADQLDTRFADGGSGSFRFLPGSANCAGNTAPPQRLSNLSSWGDATLLSGSVAPACDQVNESWMLAARLATDRNQILRSGFEG